MFLNRRGTATYVFCRDCGYVLRCSNCDSPLTFHAASERLLCHHCGRDRRMPERCPLIAENELMGTRYRHLRLGEYRTIFRVVVSKVLVLRIIHGARLLDSSMFDAGGGSPGGAQTR